MLPSSESARPRAQQRSVGHEMAGEEGGSVNRDGGQDCRHNSIRCSVFSRGCGRGGCWRWRGIEPGARGEEEAVKAASPAFEFVIARVAVGIELLEVGGL